MALVAQGVSTVPDLPPVFSAVGEKRRDAKDAKVVELLPFKREKENRGGCGGR